MENDDLQLQIEGLFSLTAENKQLCAELIATLQTSLCVLAAMLSRRGSLDGAQYARLLRALARRETPAAKRELNRMAKTIHAFVSGRVPI